MYEQVCCKCPNGRLPVSRGKAYYTPFARVSNALRVILVSLLIHLPVFNSCHARIALHVALELLSAAELCGLRSWG